MRLPERSARSDRARFLVPFLLAVAMTALIVIAWPPAPGPGEAKAGDVAPAPPAAVLAVAGTQAATPLPAERQAPPPPPGQPAQSFDERVDELVGIGRRTAELAQQDEVDGAKASDAEARARFEQLMTVFPDAGERALAAAAALPDPATEPLPYGRRIVLQLILDAELARRHDGAAAAGDRSRVDALTQAVLDSMPVTSVVRDVGERALVERPYLRAVHEPGVLALVRLAAEHRFDRGAATRVLLTLWRNLQQFGERSSDELSRLALLLLGDGDPSQRTAACRHLLADPRYRYLVLAWLREHGDAAVAAEVAGIAARELPPAEAIAVLRELAPVLPHAPSAYLVLGFRAPDVVADAYRELLATNTQPTIRSDLVTGVGMTRSPLGLEIAQLALQNDPSPEVRIQSIFVLTATGDPELAERAVEQLLDDRLVAEDPTRLGAVVLALQNLEAGGHHNSLARLGNRLRRLPLASEARQHLEAMLQRGVPGGTSNLPPLPR